MLSSNKKINKQKNPVSSNIFKIAMPMMLCHVLQTMFNLVDMIWIGRLGSESIAGIAWAGNVLMVLVTFIIGISTGTTAIITRNIGAERFEEAGRTAFHSILLGCIVSGILAVFGYFFIEKIMILLGAGVHISAIGSGYLKIIFYGSSVMFLMFITSAILQGSGDMRTPTIAIIIATIINFILDPLFIFGIGFFPKMGVEGAALATVLARTAGTFICIFGLIFKKDRKIRILPSYMKINFKIVIRLLKIGIPSSLQMMLRSIVSLVFVIIVAKFGYKAVAAYGIGLKLTSLAMMPGFGLGAATAILVGQGLGAKKFTEAVKSALVPAFYNAIIMQFFALLYYVCPIFFIKMFSTDIEVINICIEYLKVTSIPYVFIGAGFVIARALNGAGDTGSNMVITFVCLWFIQIPLALFYSVYWDMGISGIWWGIMAATFLQATSTIAWFAQWKWQGKEV